MNLVLKKPAKGNCVSNPSVFVSAMECLVDSRNGESACFEAHSLMFQVLMIPIETAYKFNVSFSHR